MVAGTQYTFKIQSRDFYSNNMNLLLADAIGDDFLITYTGPSTVQAALVDDDSPGVFRVEVTLTITGEYKLTVLLKGLQVPTQLSVNSITVTPKPVTSPATTGFTGAQPSYLTGQYVEIIITARDEFSNLRYSTDDTFTMELTSQNADVQILSGPIEAISQGDGTYFVSFMFETVEAYTIQIKLDWTDQIAGSPVTNVDVFASDVQAIYSSLYEKSAEIVAGVAQVWQI